MAEKAEKSGERLTAVFKAFAKKTGRCGGTIRNLYYRELANGRKTSLTVKKNVMFTSEEEQKLFDDIICLKKQTGSVRKAVFALANGNPVLALRYQNKFSNMLKKMREKHLETLHAKTENGEEVSLQTTLLSDYFESKKNDEKRNGRNRR